MQNIIGHSAISESSGSRNIFKNLREKNRDTQILNEDTTPGVESTKSFSADDSTQSESGLSARKINEKASFIVPSIEASKDSRPKQPFFKRLWAVFE